MIPELLDYWIGWMCAVQLSRLMRWAVKKALSKRLWTRAVIMLLPSKATKKVCMTMSNYILSNLRLKRRRVRLHWGIENQVHWILDMSFGEDQSRIRKQNAPTNVAIIRHAVLNMIRQVKTNRVSVRRMRKSAGWECRFWLIF